jgi:hypothetical protein
MIDKTGAHHAQMLMDQIRQYQDMSRRHASQVLHRTNRGAEPKFTKRFAKW